MPADQMRVLVLLAAVVAMTSCAPRGPVIAGGAYAPLPGAEAPEIAREADATTTPVPLEPLRIERRRMWRASDGEHGPASSSLAVSRTDLIDELREANSRAMNGASRRRAAAGAAAETGSADALPRVAVLACSDLAKGIEAVFDQSQSRFYEVRNLGGLADASAIESLEPAVAHLDLSTIIVLGHDDCDAVEEALASRPTAPGSRARRTGPPPRARKDSGSLRGLMREMLPPAQSGYGDGRLDVAVRKVVESTAERLEVRSKVIHLAVTQGKVRILRAIFHHETGEVEMW